MTVPMFAADVDAIHQLLGWLFVVIVTGCFLIWRYAETVRPKRERFEREWQRRFEPNLPNVAPYAQHAERDAQVEVDHAYLRLMDNLPDDHLPADWRLWGDKSGARR
jgi:hypothetical protein